MAENLILSDPPVLGGKPCIRGTRLSVEFLLELAASSETPAQSLLPGVPASGVFVPIVSHIKVSYHPDRPLEAKAYLAVELRWRFAPSA